VISVQSMDEMMGRDQGRETKAAIDSLRACACANVRRSIRNTYHRANGGAGMRHLVIVMAISSVDSASACLCFAEGVLMQLQNSKTASTWWGIVQVSNLRGCC